MGFLDHLPLLRRKERRAKNSVVRQETPVKVTNARQNDEKPKQTLPVQQHILSKSEQQAQSKKLTTTAITTSRLRLVRQVFRASSKKEPITKASNDGGSVSGDSDAISTDEAATATVQSRVSKRNSPKTVIPSRQSQNKESNRQQDQQDIDLPSIDPPFNNSDCDKNGSRRDSQGSGDSTITAKPDPSGFGGSDPGQNRYDDTSNGHSDNSTTMKDTVHKSPESAATTTSSHSSPAIAPDAGISRTGFSHIHAISYSLPAHTSSHCETSTSYSHSSGHGTSSYSSSSHGGHSSYSSSGDGGYSGGSYCGSSF
ncbi:hypothetical protein TWF696_008654 [Orbilia brochopaga]|uniref:Uncharacterized protein n=1 Tax=Orbilia brochopaga TaxID=3140254 RepID=A0AAV9UM20_9PEZI